jgi:Fe-S-cluster containining protein
MTEVAMNPEKTMLIEDLYAKVDTFQSRLRDELTSRSQCKQGCSRCCYVDLSVFEVEANRIREWFQSLGKTEQQSILRQWKEPKQDGACVFLRNESCTIYEARPLICRTQGLALSFQDEAKTWIDICPLNDSMLEIVKENEIINLDLLNRMLSGLENQDANGAIRSRIPLTALQAEIKNSTNEE